MSVYLVALIGILILGLYILDLRKHKITTREIIMIGLDVAISYVLYMIPLVRYPQGGGITFFSMLPIMLLYKIFLGSLMAGSISTFVSIVSGVIFFGQYAPPGMNLWIYSIIYNTSSAGVESLLTAIVITIMPIKMLAKRMKPINNI